MKTAAQTALKDITEYQKEEEANIFDGYNTWIVTPNTLYTKEQRRLNKEIGVSNVNYSNKNLTDWKNKPL